MKNSDNENEQNKNGEDDDKVEVFHRVNRLKLKANVASDNDKVKIDPRRVDKAQTIIETRADLYPDEMEAVLKKLFKASNDVKTAEDKDERMKLKRRMFHAANQAKDLASTFEYPLMEHFAQSLREFIEIYDPTKKPHQTIVEAHVNVMLIVLQENIKDHGDNKADELKLIVGKAIEKHS